MLNEYTLHNVKFFLKELSTKIKIAKQLRKTEINRNFNGFDNELIALVIREANARYGIEYELNMYKRIFRHHHIAYCEFKGTNRDEIECPAKHNKPNEKEINLIKEKIVKAMEVVSDEKTVCFGV